MEPTIWQDMGYNTTCHNRFANTDDGSCRYVGCQDPTASNYDPGSTVPGLCVDTIEGCTDSIASNYYPLAAANDGSCVFVGCTDSNRKNFDASVTFDDGSCLPTYAGCTDPTGETLLEWKHLAPSEP